MKKISLVLVVLLVFLGCTQKRQIVHEPLKNELLAYTSKDEIIDGSDRTLIIATYLNPIYQSKIDIKDAEVFLLAINPKEHELDAGTLRVNSDNNGTSVRLLNESDPLLDLVGFNLPWAQYYEIRAPVKEADRLTLAFEIYPSRQVELEFQKVAKSLYWNP